jgi:hypothetical protein
MTFEREQNDNIHACRHADSRRLQKGPAFSTTSSPEEAQRNPGTLPHGQRSPRRVPGAASFVTVALRDRRPITLPLSSINHYVRRRVIAPD